jgi:hypothetical protein
VNHFSVKRVVIPSEQSAQIVLALFQDPGIYLTINVLGVPDKPGDANSDGIVSIGDVVWLINYLFKGGPKPNPCWKADVNADCKVSLSDIVWLINYLFKGGPSPMYGCATHC